MFINQALLRFAKGSLQKIIQSILFQLLMTLVASATMMCMSLLIKNLLISVMTGDDVFFTKKIVVIVIGIIILLVLRKLLSRKNVVVVTKAGVSIKDNLRTKIIQKLFLLGPEYTSMTRTGALTSTFTSRVEWLMNYYTKYMPVLVSAIINAVLFIVFLTYIDFYTGFVALISIIMMLLIPMMFFNLMRNKGAEEWRWHAKYYSECLDGIQGMISLKAFNADKKYVDGIKKYGESYRKSVMDHLKVTIIEGTFLELFARIGTALTVVILAWRYTNGYVDEKFLIVAFFAVSATFSPMMSLISAWHLGFQGVSGSYSIDEFLKIDCKNILSNKRIPKSLLEREKLENYLHENNEATPDKKSRKKDESVQFSNVCFRYAGEEKNAINNVSFEIKKGKMTAFVGISGGGKSTIAGLLMGFYRPDSGNVTMNQKPLNNENVEYFHENVSAVWQNNHLFSGSINDNIKMGKWDASDKEIRSVAKKAMIDDLIMELPQGYQTNVNELGGLFSTGERQRIAIARAFLKDSPFLILDEATSSLDRENEKRIQKTLQDLKMEKGILIIAHRLQTIEKADEICFLQNGSIVARGTHKTLLLESEEYRNLVKGAV